MLARIWRSFLWLFAPKMKINLEGYHAIFRERELKQHWNRLENRHIWGTCHYINFDEPPVTVVSFVVYVGKFKTFESMMAQFDNIEAEYNFGNERWVLDDPSSVIWTCRWIKLHVTKSVLSNIKGKDPK